MIRGSFNDWWIQTALYWKRICITKVTVPSAAFCGILARRPKVKDFKRIGSPPPPRWWNWIVLVEENASEEATCSNSHSMSHLRATSWVLCNSPGRRNDLINYRDTFGYWQNRPFSSRASQWGAGVYFPVSSWACAIVKTTVQFACTIVSVPCKGRSTSNAFISANKQHYLMKQGELSETDHTNFSQIWKKITVWNGHVGILLHARTENNQPNKTFPWP